MVNTTLEDLPEECLSYAISCTSPFYACQSSLVSRSFCNAAISDLVWEKFLPPDYREIISRSNCPLKFLSKKDLFRQFSSAPLLIDGGEMSFSMDRCTNKKCYMLSARKLSITWSTNSLYWCWKTHLSSRFPEAIELIMVCWLEIHGKIKCRFLSPNISYTVCLVLQLADRAFGLDVLPFEVSIEVGDYKKREMIYMKHGEYTRQKLDLSSDMREHVLSSRGDGWLEIELGEFYNNRSSEEEVKVSFRETKGQHLKGGLLVEGIEFRPRAVRSLEW